mgnify:CR=1 FL=1
MPKTWPGPASCSARCGASGTKAYRDFSAKLATSGYYTVLMEGKSVFDMFERAKAGNLCVLTGDVHSSWAYDLPRDPFTGYDKATGKGSAGFRAAATSSRISCTAS